MSGGHLKNPFPFVGNALGCPPSLFSSPPFLSVCVFRLPLCYAYALVCVFRFIDMIEAAFGAVAAFLPSERFEGKLRCMFRLILIVCSYNG